MTSHHSASDQVPSTAPGTSLYLPEEYHFLDTTAVPLEALVRVTTRCIARWAERYEAYVLTRPDNRREGPLPDDIEGRESTLDGVLKWLENASDRPALGALRLYRDAGLLLDAHDGLPGVLILEPDQYAALQACWERHGFPRNLYYPAKERRTVIEPVEKFGGVVQAHKVYTPVQWAHRDIEVSGRLRIPSEEDRVERFVRACEQFVQTLLLRVLELSEPGKERDQVEVSRLVRLQNDILAAARRARPPGRSASDEANP